MNLKQDRPDGAGRKVSPKLIVGGVLALLALIFVFQNTDSRSVNLLFWDLTAPTWLWLLVIFAVGVIVGLLLPRLRRDSAG